MRYTADDHMSKLHLVMLSPSTAGSNISKNDKLDSSLYFYVNRPIAAIMYNPLFFMNLLPSVSEIRPHGYAIMSMEAFYCVGADDCAVPADNEGMVLRFKLMPGVENPTEVIAKLGKAMAEYYGVSLYDTYISGRIGQEEPDSYEVLNLKDFPAQYVDQHAVMALPQRELIDS